MTIEMSRLTRRLVDTAAPLAPDEQQRAIAAAIAHLGGDLSVYGAEVRIDKPTQRNAKSHRRIAVRLGDPGANTVHEILVDTAGTVVGAARHEGVVVPFTATEIDRAIAIAESDPAVAHLARRKGVMRAPFYPSAHAHNRHKPPGGRRVGFHFLSAANPRRVHPLLSVVVDLSDAQIDSTVTYQPSGTNQGR
jgi:hypothetical protein